MVIRFSIATQHFHIHLRILIPYSTYEYTTVSLLLSGRVRAQVDVFGACGRPCPDGCDSALLGRRYWFVLALENSRCEHYVTEKYWNKLHADALPVVNGGLHGERDYLEIGVLSREGGPCRCTWLS